MITLIDDDTLGKLVRIEVGCTVGKVVSVKEILFTYFLFKIKTIIFK